jgi:hypothetical protein
MSCRFDNPPTIDVIFWNDLGFVPVLTRANAGDYNFTFAGGFPQDKVWVSAGSHKNASDDSFLNWVFFPPDVVKIVQDSLSANWASNDIPNMPTMLEIRVYP